MVLRSCWGSTYDRDGLRAASNVMGNYAVYINSIKSKCSHHVVNVGLPHNQCNVVKSSHATGAVGNFS